MGYMKTGSIQVIPKPEISSKIDVYKQQLRTSRAGFCHLAIDFLLPMLESGRAQVVNGKVEIVNDSQGEKTRNTAVSEVFHKL